MLKYKTTVERVTDNFHDLGPLLKMLGVKLVSIKPGYCKLKMKVNQEHMNPHRVLHGGIPFILADTAMGLAISKLLKETELSATVNMEIYFYRSVTGPTELSTEGRVIQKGDRIVYTEAMVKRENDTIAKATAVFYIKK